MSRYPGHLAPDSQPSSLGRRPRGRREPSGAFQVFQERQIKQFKEAFSLIDQDGDGIISEKDLKAVFANLGIPPSTNTLDNLLSARPGKQFQAPILFTEDDSMPDRGINFTMFLTMMGERLFQFDAEPELIEAFECFDENDTGMVKVKELRECLAEMGDRMTSEEIDFLLKGPFTDRQGNFKYREWAKVVRIQEEAGEEGEST